jgi:ATP/maltotriose-dependent transcriptional regulator MalT
MSRKSFLIETTVQPRGRDQPAMRPSAYGRPVQRLGPSPICHVGPAFPILGVVTSSRAAISGPPVPSGSPPAIGVAGKSSLRPEEAASESSVETDRAVLVATKLQAPPVRDQLVGRDGLLERLSAGAGLRLTLVACPAGFGKTSLLTAWYRAEVAGRAMAWLTLDKDDNDPAVLWSYLLEALGRVCPDLGGAAQVSAGLPVVELLRLVNALAEQSAVTLILDDFHLLTDGSARESIHWLVAHAPPNFQLVLSTRREPDLALATLRGHGDLLELRADDLRFTAEEADRFLNGRQLLGLTSADVDLLVERTAGWPAGLYLAALSLRRADDRHDLVTRFGASNRHVLDFLESEVMEAHDPADEDFMVRCSILDRLAGPLCDAVLELSGSAEALQRLSRSNLFLTPLDDQGDWYRFHPLFAQLLRVELERRDPGLAVDLHCRAFAWYREHGDTTEAVGHAIEAGMDAEAADLVAAAWFHYVNTGRNDTVLGWIERFPADVLDGDVRLLLTQAWTQSLSGRQAQAEDATARAERLVGLETAPLPDGFSSAEASLATLRGVFPWGNVQAAHGYALRALELEGQGSPWHAVASWAVALAQFSQGRHAEADALFTEAAALSSARGYWWVACTAVGYRSLIAGHAGRVEAQAQLAEEAMALAREHGIENNSAGPPMALGASLTARGRPAEALPILEQSVALARFQGQPILLVRTLRYLAETLAMLGEHDRSASASAEARSVLAACADPGLPAEMAASFERPGREGVKFVNGPLTHREFTVLTLLAGDLSEADIARELFVSHSTVHSHVKSIYRKLGVSSRAEALERARAAGFLPEL